MDFWSLKMKIRMFFGIVPVRNSLRVTLSSIEFESFDHAQGIPCVLAYPLAF